MPYKYEYSGGGLNKNPFDGWEMRPDTNELLLFRIADALEELVRYEREKNYREMMKEIKEYEINIETRKGSRPSH
jgi:hypothetical protein